MLKRSPLQLRTTTLWEPLPGGGDDKKANDEPAATLLSYAEDSVLLGRPGQVSDLVQISNIDWNRNVGRIAVIQEVLQSDLHWNRRDHLAKTRHLQIFHTPDFQHQ